jgi:hypothetical protein
MQQLPVKINFFDALKKGLALVSFSFRGTFIYAFVISLINQLLAFGIGSAYSIDGDKISINAPSLFILYFGLLFLNMLFGNCLILIRQNAILANKKLTLKQTVQPILERFPGILGSGLAFFLLSMMGMGLYLIPGLLFLTLFYLYLPSLIFAHKKAFESWAYSLSLIKKHFFSTLGLVLVSLILLWVPRMIINSLGNSFSESNTYFGLEVTGMVLLVALTLLLMNALNLIWFYLLHQNKQ